MVDVKISLNDRATLLLSDLSFGGLFEVVGYKYKMLLPAEIIEDNTAYIEIEMSKQELKQLIRDVMKICREEEELCRESDEQ